MEALCAPHMENIYGPAKSSAHVKHEVRDFYGLGTTTTNPQSDKLETTSPTLPPKEEEGEAPKEKSSFRKSLSNFLTSPAKKSHDRVLASTYQKEQGNSPYQHSTLSSEDSLAREKEEQKELTDAEKAKRLVAERDASSPTGNFVLGAYKPLSASQGYGDYYTAKGMSGK